METTSLPPPLPLFSPPLPFSFASYKSMFNSLLSLICFFGDVWCILHLGNSPCQISEYAFPCLWTIKFLMCQADSAKHLAKQEGERYGRVGTNSINKYTTRNPIRRNTRIDFNWASTDQMRVQCTLPFPFPRHYLEFHNIFKAIFDLLNECSC